MNQKISDDLAHIKSMMERSSRFISLSGLSGVGAGIVGLITGVLAMYFTNGFVGLNQSEDILYNSQTISKLILLGVFALFFAISFGSFFTIRKSKKLGLQIWTSTTKKILSSLTIPLVVGGVFVLALLQYGLYGLIAGTTLIFYGLALVNAEKYTFSDIKYLGFLEIVLGCLSLFFIGKGLLFWTIGFGVLHIIYGIILHRKYN
ncbi:hypothetical protein H1R17_12365 [Flavobacterium sp. xlx-214]|uniref:hypothetical protein n=1 Tax=unclassified Flavobacterium TaxID=196869 RepID=UPI0013D6B9E4|nr:MULTISPECIES: hypothetical protein [unclassified Flavobacterium]MBA5793740.1 hypothetical protein [Flavobacterium sp. xlx-221]QMI83239.1 hypothetical protein H1R17_12365 [Flavobacterium sp. xlx-214]